MTNEEKAKEYAKSQHKDKELQKIVAYDFIAGAEWKEQQMIEKAIEWLDDNLRFGVHPQNASGFIKGFKKVMEEE